MVSLAGGYVIGDRVRVLRLARGWSQNDLAQRSGVHLQLIQRMEQGRSTDPTWSTVQRLARGLEVPIDQLRDDAEGAAPPTAPPDPPKTGRKPKKA